MRISDWSSDVCSSDLYPHIHHRKPLAEAQHICVGEQRPRAARTQELIIERARHRHRDGADMREDERIGRHVGKAHLRRSEEHTSELQSLMRISYAVFRLKKTTI